MDSIDMKTSDPFADGPTPTADRIRDRHMAVSFWRHKFRRLERRCRAAEALLRAARDSVVARPLQREIDDHRLRED